MQTLAPHLPELSFILEDLSRETDRALLERTRTDFAKQNTETVMGMTAKQLVAEAETKAEAKAKADMLLRQLGKKFGRVP